MVCYQSYAQEDPWGEELEDVIICNEPDDITVDDYGSYTITETCVWSNIDGIATNDCEWNCSTVVADKPDDGSGGNDEPDCNGDPGGSAYLANCGCIGGSTGRESCNSDPDPDPGSGSSGNPCGNQIVCPNGQQLNYTTCNCECTRTCPPGYRLNLLSCNCEKETPCTTTCPVGFDLIDCQCRVNPCLNSDLRHKEISTDVKNLIDQREKTVFMNGSYVDVKLFEIQEIEDGWGDINLDKYALNITNLPNGYQPQMLFDEIRRDFSDFVTGGSIVGTSVKLEPYSIADGNKWESSNPIGAVMNFNNFMDTSTVICTEYNYDEMYWTFTTVHSLDHQGHFVSGHRQFGIETNSDGSYSFYLRGADRLGQLIDYSLNGFDSGHDFLFNNAADATWKNLMSNLEKFIKSKTGAIIKPFDKNKVYAERFEYNENDCPE
ncbi:hypothetical protein [Flavobacterium chungangense]|uniref:hypothetical protein n=1 Tax=Flavobacterium chungangense TaxID=554283 RepID=UPI0012FC7CB6|nr:hypothetical protein [Flavobacterium chungangense]